MSETTVPTIKERLAGLTASIEKGIQELFQSDRYAKYLRTMAQFHPYSLGNTMLIYLQKPEATMVAGFDKWKNRFSRNVKRGEKSIRIIAPVPYKKTVKKAYSVVYNYTDEYGETKQKWETWHTQKEALKRKAEIENSQLSGVFCNPTSMTIEDLNCNEARILSKCLAKRSLHQRTVRYFLADYSERTQIMQTDKKGEG